MHFNLSSGLQFFLRTQTHGAFFDSVRPVAFST